MSNSEFRAAQTRIREELMPQLPNAEFWDVLLHLIIYKRQAFLSCVCAAERLARDGLLDLNCNEAHTFARHMIDNEPESVPKVLNMLLPLLSDFKQMQEALLLFDVNDERERLAILLRMESTAAYYLLFCTLQHIGDAELARRCALFVLKRGTDSAHNMAGILAAYFGIVGLPLRSVLTIHPYELSYLEQSYDTFCKFLGKN